MKKKLRIGAWLFSIFLFTGALVYMPSVSSFIFLALGIVNLPIKAMDSLWDRLLKGKRNIKVIIVAVIFFIGCTIAPTLETETNKDLPPIETETVTEITTETETAQSTEEQNATEVNTEKETTGKKEETETKDIESHIDDGSKPLDNISLDSIPAYDSAPYVVINNNNPFFTDEELTTTAFEEYSELDSLGRCGVAYANVCKEIMPTEKRGEIGSVKPSGWHTVKYDCVDGKYLYNRCHLIGYQLSGENANAKNLITGTRYLNVDGMLPFENMVADYVKETNNHVLYRVTPIFSGDNLVASGVLMEAKSVEDDGAGILFNVYCYNMQPGVDINYSTGDSSLSQETAAENTTSIGISNDNGTSSNETTTPADTPAVESDPEPTVTNVAPSTDIVYITDTGKKYHNAGCRYLSDSCHEISKTDAEAQGYEPCKVCH